MSEENDIKYPDGSSRQADGTVQLPDGRTLGAAEFEAGKSGTLLPDGCVLLPTGLLRVPERRVEHARLQAAVAGRRRV